MNKPDNLIKNHVSQYFWHYTFITFFFILGICIGAITVNGLVPDAKLELKNYIEGFLNFNINTGIEHGEVLRQSIKFNIFSALFLYLSGLTYLGIVFVPLFSSFRGFCIGFTIAFLTDSLGRGGFLLAVASFLPHNIVCIPVIFVLCAFSLDMALRKVRSGQKRYLPYDKKRSSMASYTMATALMFVLLIMGSLLEAYITSSLIQYLSPYIL